MTSARASQWLRGGLQLGVLGFVVYAALGGPWRNYKLAHNHRRLVTLIEGDVWGTLYGWNEDLLALAGDSFETSLAFLGFPWAARIFGLDTADPLLVTAHAVTTLSVPWGLLIALVPATLLALVLGRVFCSHLCPMRLLFEWTSRVRRGLVRLGLPLPELRSAHRLGGWVLIGGLLATLSAGSVVWLFILPYVSLSAGIFLWISAGSASVLLAVAAFWLAIDGFLAPGFFCHNLCPTGFTLDQLARFAPLRVRKRDRKPCPPSCALCHEACPYSLTPKEDVRMAGCDNCGVCVSACPTGKLARVVSLGVLIAILGGSESALAHHNKGLPHYGYYDNYPQAPTEEFVAIDGPWEIGAVLFNFQGLDRRTADTPNDVKIYLYLYDDRTGRAYEGPLEVELRQGDEVVSTFRRATVDEEAVYSTRETLPRSGSYDLVARVGDEEIVLPFEVELANDGVRWGWVAGIAVPSTAVAALAAIGRSRRHGRRRRSR
jgi:ferredoxin-type protein NapH